MDIPDRPGRPSQFRPFSPPRSPVAVKNEQAGRHRGSPRDRGYDAKWDRMSIAFRRQNPFCRFCDQLGRDNLGGRADHILPAREYPELKYVWGNVQNLCPPHDNLKQRMENFARQTGQVAMLKIWSTDPSSRPPQFRPQIPILDPIPQR